MATKATKAKATDLTTAVKISPALVKKAKTYGQDVLTLKKIEGSNDLQTVSQVLAGAVALRKEIEASYQKGLDRFKEIERQAYLGRKEQEAERDKYLVPVLEVERRCRFLRSEWEVAEEERKEKEAREARRLLAEAAEKLSAADCGEVELTGREVRAAERQLDKGAELLAAASEKEKTDDVSVSMVWKLVGLIDPAMLHPAYLIPNEKKINALIKANGREAVAMASLPGKRAFEVKREAITRVYG